MTVKEKAQTNSHFAHITIGKSKISIQTIGKHAPPWFFTLDSNISYVNISQNAKTAKISIIIIRGSKTISVQ